MAITSASRFPSVAVILATRDRPVLLRTAVRSVIAQDYAGVIEVVVWSTTRQNQTRLSQSWPRLNVR